MIFFRVFKDADDKVGTLYNRLFQPVTKTQPGPADLVISSNPEHFAQITEANPEHIMLRVHADKQNKNPAEGRFYNESFESVNFKGGKVELPSGHTVILTVTPDEFEAMVSTRG